MKATETFSCWHYPAKAVSEHVSSVHLESQFQTIKRFKKSANTSKTEVQQYENFSPLFANTL